MPSLLWTVPWRLFWFDIRLHGRSCGQHDELCYARGDLFEADAKDLPSLQAGDAYVTVRLHCYDHCARYINLVFLIYSIVWELRFSAVCCVVLNFMRCWVLCPRSGLSGHRAAILWTVVTVLVFRNCWHPCMVIGLFKKRSNGFTRNMFISSFFIEFLQSAI